MDYDVFISYRREYGGELAQLVCDRLKDRGIRVFFDLESLNNGKFNEELYQVIENTPNFVVILVNHALDRCVNEGDWVRREVVHAIQCEKNIIPYLKHPYAFPEDLPEDMRELPSYNGVEHYSTSRRYMDAAIDELIAKMELPADFVQQPREDDGAETSGHAGTSGREINPEGEHISAAEAEKAQQDRPKISVDPAELDPDFTPQILPPTKKSLFGKMTYSGEDIKNIRQTNRAQLEEAAGQLEELLKSDAASSVEACRLAALVMRIVREQVGAPDYVTVRDFDIDSARAGFEKNYTATLAKTREYALSGEAELSDDIRKKLRQYLKGLKGLTDSLK